MMSSALFDRRPPTWRDGFAVLLLALFAGGVLAHGVADGDARFMEQNAGARLLPFLYLGAKHMATGYDHLLFLVGVIFFLYRMKDVGLYVSLFAIGHSVTLLYGVLSGTHVNPYLVDAIIGLSVVYKGLDNLGAFKAWFGVQPDTRAAVLIFGLFHGFGLATKLQDFNLPDEGLVANIIAFIEDGMSSGRGTFRAPFDGHHGWYWKNDGAEVVNIKLVVSGFFDEIYMP